MYFETSYTALQYLIMLNDTPLEYEGPTFQLQTIPSSDNVAEMHQGSIIAPF